MVTVDEAARCPKCREVGKVVRSGRGPQLSTARNYQCENEMCRWFQTGWVVQIKADGTIPERSQGDKTFEPLDLAQRQAGQRMIEAIEEEENRPTGPGTVR